MCIETYPCMGWKYSVSTKNIEKVKDEIKQHFELLDKGSEKCNGGERWNKTKLTFKVFFMVCI